MSCRHSLANGTCTRCNPTNPDGRAFADRVDPGPEHNYEPNLDGPGAVPDDRLSIAGLQEQHAAMTGGCWEVDVERDQQANIFAGEQWIAILPHRSVRGNEANHVLDAAGICALQTAAALLLEIAAAALAVEAQDGLRDSKAVYALRAALAKVRQ
jgi:hypothetical protein